MVNIPLKRLVAMFALLIFFCSFGVACAEPTKIIFETDLTFDVDDVGALAMLHALADEAEAEILGVSYNEVHADAVKAIDAINSWYGRGDVPIGTFNKKLAAPDNSGYLTAVAKNSTVDSKPTMKSLDMYKMLLAAQPDTSVVISSVGFTNNLFDLLNDPKGKQLVEQKVKLLVLMGGDRNDDFNFARHETADEADYVIRNWPGRVVISYEGGRMCTGNGLLKTPDDSPVRQAYIAATPWLAKEHGVGNRCKNRGEEINQPSWDQVSTLFAVRHASLKGDLFSLKTDGTVNTRNHGSMEYQKGKLEYVVSKNKPVTKNEIERLMVRPPNHGNVRPSSTEVRAVLRPAEESYRSKVANDDLYAADGSFGRASKLTEGPNIDIGLQKQLLVDDYVIAEKHNITRELGKVKKVGVVMQASVPTDHNPKDTAHFDGYRFMRTTVLWNEQRQIFQAMYSAGSPFYPGYAESRDGMRWTKPFVSKDGKSNLIRFSEKPRARSHWNSSSFMIDPTLPWGHREKFKAAYDGGNAMCVLAYSADGIKWQAYNDGNPVTGRAADTSNQVVWDPIVGRYLLLTRTDLGDKGGPQESRATRIMVHNNGGDLRSHPTAWETLTTIAVDDPKDKKTSSGSPVLQMEAMTLWIYENVYFGLMHVLTSGELMGHGNAGKARPNRRNETDVMDFYIGTSRDAVMFDRSWINASKPLIPRGGDDDFDRNMVNVASEIITRANEHWLYYQGSDNQHHDHVGLHGAGGKLGLATLPLDRFIRQQAQDKLGTVTTKPFKLEGGTLQVNVDARKGRFYAEVLDADGKPIQDFTASEAKVFHGVDELRLKPQWKNNRDLSSLKGKTIRLRFYLYDASLYAFLILDG